MPQTIFLRIGSRDRIPLRDFIDSLRNFLGLLHDLDATVSADQHGSVVWEVVSLRQDSPPIIGVGRTVRPRMQDFSGVVATQVLENTRLLTGGRDPNQFMSTAALERLGALARSTRRLGPSVIYINGSGPKQESQVTEKTLERVQCLTSVTFSGCGSIFGTLESITVHKKNEFRIWDETTRKPITCKFQPDQEDRVKSLLRHRVSVSGMIYSNSAGVPIKLDAEDVVPVEQKALPTISEMSGLIDDFTEGKTLREYLDAISDE